MPMKTYEITYSNGDNIYSANLVIAESADQATAYYTAEGREVIGCTETMSRPKPGQPVVTVPEGWTTPAAETETETAEQTPDTEQDTPAETTGGETTETAQDGETAQGADAELMRRISDAVDRATARTAYERGVKAYAKELAECLAETVAQAIKAGKPSPLDNRETVRAALLNGARDWQDYSYGGCSLIYDGDIAERLCTPSELRRKRGGELPPNREETWLDVQARALNRAARGILKVYDILAKPDGERITDILDAIRREIVAGYYRPRQRITTKSIREAERAGQPTVRVGYCNAQWLLSYLAPTFYTAGIYGWNCDIYCVAGLTICTGYRGMVGEPAALTADYEQRARAAAGEDERSTILAEWIAVNLDMLKADREGATI